MISQVTVKLKLLKKHYCSKRSTDLLKKYAKKKKNSTGNLYYQNSFVRIVKIALLEATFKKETFKEQLSLE